MIIFQFNRSNRSTYLLEGFHHHHIKQTDIAQARSLDYGWGLVFGCFWGCQGVEVLLHSSEISQIIYNLWNDERKDRKRKIFFEKDHGWTIREGWDFMASAMGRNPNNFIIIIPMSIHVIRTLQNRQLQDQVNWMRQEGNYSKLSNQDIQQQNRKVLQTLKNLEGRLDKQLQQQKYSRISVVSQENVTDPIKIVNQNIKNNQNIIKVLEKDARKLRDRREELKNGLESKLNGKKYDLEKRISDLKTQLKRLKLQENQINKKLSTRENPIQPQYLSQHGRLQQQLRVFSLKYMKIVDKYNKVTQQLANASNTSEPQLHIPEEIYDKQLEEREEAQFKEYQGIVKMCTILSKRNDSQTNKYNRLYTQKLKELERIIVNLGQIDRMIALKEGEILEGRKNLELVKFRSSVNGERVDEFMSVSQSQLRRISYSTARLPVDNSQARGKQHSQGHKPPRKLSKMG